MNIQWIANVINNEEEKESFETYVKNNQRLLKRLNEIISQKQMLLMAKEFNINSYETPSWSHVQAHINGRMEALEEIRQLTDLS